MDWHSIGTISGAALLGVTGLQLMTAVFRYRRRIRNAQARRANQRTLFEKQLRTVLNWARAAKPIYRAWSGTRPMQVAAIQEEALDCKSFYLLPVDGRPLPRFEPGQYLTFELPVHGNQAPVVRCYSLSDRPREDYYRITVKRITSVGGDNLPEGEGSGFFHRQVKVGSTLDVRAPQGAFFLDPRDELPVVLIGGGIGITPIISMAESIVHDRSDRQVYVFGGFRNSRENPFAEILNKVGSEQESIRVDITYSRPMPGDLRGRDYDNKGHIDIARLREVLPSNNFRFYVCGPPAMMESLVPALLSWGVPDDHIHFEAFGPASVKRLSTNSSKEPRNVKFAKTQKSLVWTGQEQSLLDLAESNGVVLDSGCRAGNCGQCMTGVRSGKCLHVKHPGVPVGDDACLTCIAIPEEDLVLEA